MKYIVLDTETTGLSHETGDRLIEIGGIEMINHIPTGRIFHKYLNPDRDIHPDAIAVHGITLDFLQDKPRFAEIAEEFLAFIEGAALVIHNAAFDAGFLNSELKRLSMPLIVEDQLIDTLVIARQRHPMSQNSLDALCRRYNVDNTKRTKHGALLDAELLADVYVELIGARQPNLTLVTVAQAAVYDRGSRGMSLPVRPRPLTPRLTAEEEQAHLAFVGTLGAEAVWLDYVRLGE